MPKRHLYGRCRLCHSEDRLVASHVISKQTTQRSRKVKDFENRKLKNGLLSSLWRMSLSAEPHFSEVDLGDKHEERLRIAFLSDVEFEEDEYRILLAAPLFNGRNMG